jgi:spectinomycin phosphotransferase
VLGRPEGLSDARVATALRDGWALEPTALDYQPVGFGSYHWRAEAGGAWFVTVDDLDAKRRRLDDPPGEAWRRLTAALATARALADAGLGFVAAPRPTATGDVLWPVDGRYALALYPWVEGEVYAWGAYANRRERLAVLDLLVALHGAPAALAATALADDFAVEHRDRLTAALADLATPWDTGPFGEPTRRLLERHAEALARALDHYDRLVATVAEAGGPHVLTHGEPHRANTITTAAGVVLIDWDTTLVAPPERDLWALAHDDPAILDDYRARTGVAPRPEVADLYRRRWDLTDVAIYSGRFHSPHAEGEDSRHAFGYLGHYLAACARPG